MELTPEILAITKYLGFHEPSIEECVKITSTRTIESYNNFIERKPEMKPVLTKDAYDYICLDTLDIIVDWNCIMKIANELGIVNIPTDKDKAIQMIAYEIRWIIPLDNETHANLTD